MWWLLFMSTLFVLPVTVTKSPEWLEEKSPLSILFIGVHVKCALYSLTSEGTCHLQCNVICLQSFSFIESHQSIYSKNMQMYIPARSHKLLVKSAKTLSDTQRHAHRAFFMRRLHDIMLYRQRSMGWCLWSISFLFEECGQSACPWGADLIIAWPKALDPVTPAERHNTSVCQETLMYSHCKCVCLWVYTVCYFHHSQSTFFFCQTFFFVFSRYLQSYRHILNRYLQFCNIFQSIFNTIGQQTS